jgi:hypothetical protein
MQVMFFFACIVPISSVVSALKDQTIPIDPKYSWLRRTSVGAQRGFSHAQEAGLFQGPLRKT